MKISHANHIIEFNFQYLKGEFQKKVEKAVRSQFSSFQEKKGEPAIVFSFTQSNSEFFRSKGRVQKLESFKTSNEALWFKNEEIDVVYKSENAKDLIFIALKDNESFKSQTRLANKAFCNNLETQITRFYYRIFLLFTQLFNVRNAMTFIHGSCVKINNHGFLFLADSGVGKSSILFNMSRNNLFSFIADDLTLISKEGDAFFIGRKISTKPYHLNNFPFLKDLVEDKMPFLQKIQWKIIKDNRLNFRLCPIELFQGQYASQSKLKKVFHLVNSESKSFSMEAISVEKLADLNTSILSNELFLSLYNLNKISSIPDSPLISSTQILVESKEIIRQSLKSCECFLVTVPTALHPDKLYNYLEEKGCFD